jgi:phosphoglucosamine mutase
MMLESAITTGLLAQGVDVFQVGVVPTPAVAFLTQRLGAKLGIVISASHNPVDDNGIKFFGPKGYKLDDELEEHLQTMVLDPELTFTPHNTRELGRFRSSENKQQMYIDYLVESWRGEKDLSGLLVLLECANGATSFIAPEVFRRLGAEVEVVNGSPDGLNINESYEYVNPKRFGALVKKKGANLGVALDGDGDRVVLLDEQGRIVDGDAIIAILARKMLASDKLPGRVVVTTNMSNYGLHESLREIGVAVLETKVGDKFVLRQMLASGCTLGGERSGHILILDEGQTTGDGICTALAIAAAVVDDASNRLSELASVIPLYPQFIESIDVSPEKPPLEENDGVKAILKQLETSLGTPVDINLRYSGTEDKLRLSVRGLGESDPSLMVTEARKALQQIAQTISM